MPQIIDNQLFEILAGIYNYYCCKVEEIRISVDQLLFGSKPNLSLFDAYCNEWNKQMDYKPCKGGTKLLISFLEIIQGVID